MLARGVRSGLRWRRLLFWLAGCGCLVAGAAFLWALLGPLPADPASRLPNGPTVFLDRNGVVLYELPAGGRDLRLWTPLASIAPAVRSATVDVEDARFYRRPIGLDPLAMLRAAWQVVRRDGTPSGASTIDEQLARTLYLPPAQRGSRSPFRKLQEWVWALRLGRRYSHQQVLELYLNAVDYGNSAVGIEAASQVYFGKPARDLDLAEAALLAGLPQSPVRFDPLRYPDAAIGRRNEVLQLMRRRGAINAAQMQAAATEPFGLAPLQHPLQAPYFVAMVRQQVEAALGADRVAAGGLTVRTTLDLGLQRAAAETVTHRLADLADNNVTDAAAVEIDPASGEVLALVGGADYFDPAKGGNFNAAIALRQPGSAIKPVVYAAALESGMTPASELDDIHQSFTGESYASDAAGYAPNDYDDTFHGPVTMRVALASSLNVPAVEAFDRTGRGPVLQIATKLGLGVLASSSAGLSLALGGGEVRLLDLTAAYGAIDEGGLWREPVTLLRVEDATGRTLLQPHGQSQQAMSSQAAYLLTDMLSDDDARALGFGYHSVLELNRPAAVKTGTTSDFRDNWTVGYTPQLVVGVWTGNADGQPMRDVSGVSGAAPIWHELMERALAGRPIETFKRPDGIVSEVVCSPTGLLPGPDCPHQTTELFVSGTEPHEVEHYYQALDICSTDGALYDLSCPGPAVRQVFPFPPAELVPWMREAGIALPPVPPYAAGGSSSAPNRNAASAGAAGQTGLVLASPDDGATYSISRELPLSQQALTVQASPAGVGSGDITLLVDGSVFADLTAPPYRATWPLQPGSHVFVAEAQGADGATVTSRPARITVEP